MSTRNTLIPVFILSLTFLVVQNATAGKVYRWTDEEGVVHFSDIPPVDTSLIEIREINIDEFNGEDTDPDMYSIINQADRMAERRRQETEERLAIKRLQLEEKRLANELEISQLNEAIDEQEEGSGYYYQGPGYYYPYLRYHSYSYPQQLHHRNRHKHHTQENFHHRSRKTHKSAFLPHGLQNKTRHSKAGARFSNF